MTNEEVFKIIQDAITKIQRSSSGSTELLEVALEAIGKQIPVKPIRLECTRYCVDYKCPKCQVYVDGKYCPFCGQRIDWEDERV